MKAFIVICMMTVGFLYAQNNPSETVNKETRNFFVGIVVDASPASQKVWNIRKARAIELIAALEQGDKVIVLKAKPGSPSVCGKTVIGSPRHSGSNEIIAGVSLLNKELLSSTDVARACESAYDIFISEGSGFQCLLVVLTSGKISHSQTQRIIRTSGQIKSFSGFVALTYDPAVVNQNIITAGKKNDFDLLLESNPDFAGWIRAKRGTPEPEKVIIEKTKYVFVEPDLAPLTTMIDKALTSLKPDIDTPQSPAAPETKADPEHDIILAPPPADSSTAAEVTSELPQNIGKTKAKSRSIVPWLLILLTAGILTPTALLVTAYRKRKTGTDEPDNATAQPVSLKAVVGEQEIDLGDVERVSELTLGSDPGCGIFIEDDQLSPQQARLFKVGKTFKLQNFDPQPVFVNGVEVKHKKKVVVQLPADILLPNGMTLNLYTENTPEVKEQPHG